MFLGWSYALFKCIVTIKTNGFDSFSLFLNTFELYLFLLSLSLVGLVILFFRGQIERIIGVIHFTTLLLITFSICQYPETIKNVFLLELSLPIVMIPLYFNDCFKLLSPSSILNIFIITFPVAILGEFVYLSTSFLIVDFPFAFYLIINILLLLLGQPIILMVVIAPVIKTKTHFDESAPTHDVTKDD
ncbi:hypothetical protein ENU1_173460 [Entamoeba nuttalli P19]|uniref:Uncharacterized protein n=1 Tax=Entamoeba nuttalli (strain P19) TaxID=1076696 RepID=K2GWP7_ENTNP|nr:hypothetical protein ENU1_173460 [Entamoeba nuttalli P19]EKE38187.1 hypothetical protein ENU1_173460 [Entamoeba nuttalli P19]|eukprot:XP_008859455.1 hypothetical protein ENU1_173460 [Entamoeba nuttalli P19]